MTLRVPGIMWHTSLAMAPGGFVLAWFLGPGIIINVIVAITACVAMEAAALAARRRPASQLRDGSAAMTGLIIGLCLPPLTPVLYIVVGSLFAIVIAKHLYGGLGQNLFNPAMVGYAAMVVAWPLALSIWPASDEQPTLTDLAAIKFHLVAADGFSGATPLDQFRYREGLTTEEFWALGGVNITPWLWSNVAFLAGGAWLLYRRIISWAAPVSMLLTLIVLSVLLYDSGSSHSLGSPYLHLFTGATMMAAFFIVTDPVSSPDARIGQYLFGAGVGLLTFVIRAGGGYPEGVAFAVLLMNAASPLIDHLYYRGRHAIST